MSKPYHMKGKNFFYPHGYINSWAEHLIGDTQFIEQGQGNYFRISCLLAVLSFEAYLNYVGERLVDRWKERDPWKKKLKTLLNKFNALDKIREDPLSLLDDLFRYRNQFAHGRIEENPVDYLDYGAGIFEGDRHGDPIWYKEFGVQERAVKTLQTIRASMMVIHKLSDPTDERMPWKIFGSASSSEVKDNN